MKKRKVLSILLTLTAVGLGLTSLSSCVWLYPPKDDPTPVDPGHQDPDPEDPTPVDPSTVAVTGVTLNLTTGNIMVGGTLRLNASVKPFNATNQNVTWASSNERVATVENGVVRGVAAGEATISVTTEDGNKKAECVVTVREVTYSIEITNKEELEKSFPNAEGPRKINLSVEPEGSNISQLVASGEIAISSSDPAIAEISGQTIISKGVGEAVITVEYKGHSDSVTVSCTDFAEEPEVTEITVNELLANEELFDNNHMHKRAYTITGYVVAWNTGKADGTKYGNFMLADSLEEGAKQLLVYGSTTKEDALVWAGAKYTFTNPQDFLTDEITKTIGINSKVTMKVDTLNYNGKPELEGIIYTVDNSAVSGETYPEPAIEEKSLADIIENGEVGTKAYKTSAVVKSYKAGATAADQYGNLVVTDPQNEEAEIIVYGATATESALEWKEKAGTYAFTNPKDFLTNAITKQIQPGDVLEIKTIRADFQGTKQLNVIILKAYRDGVELQPEEQPEEPPVEPTVETITVAKALEIATALDDNATTEDSYNIRGFITGVATAYSDQYHNISLWLSDDPAVAGTFQAFRVACNSADEAAKLVEGAEIIIKDAKITKYVKEGKDPVLETAAGATYELVTGDDPETPPEMEIITVSAALEIARGLEDNGTTEDTYNIKGYITKIATEYSDQYHNISFWMADDATQTGEFEAFRIACSSADEAAKLVPGTLVIIKDTKITKYVKEGKDPVLETVAGASYEIVSEEEPETPPEVNTIDVATAADIARGLEDNGITEETYNIKGFITKIATAYSEQYHNISFWMADDATQTGEFEAFRIACSSADEAAKLVPGTLVIIKDTKITKYVKEGKDPVLETVAGASYEIINQEEPENPPVENTISVAEALKIADALEDNGKTGDQYNIQGYITKIETAYNSQYGNISFWMADDPAEEGQFEAFRVKVDAGVVDKVVPGALVIVKDAYLKKYVKTGAAPILETDANATLEIVKEAPEGPAIPEENKLSVQAAIEKCKELGANNSSSEYYEVTGYIVFKEGNDLFLSDENVEASAVDQDNQFEVYSYAGSEAAKCLVGAKITVTCTLKYYLSTTTEGKYRYETADIRSVEVLEEVEQPVDPTGGDDVELGEPKVLVSGDFTSGENTSFDQTVNGIRIVISNGTITDKEFRVFKGQSITISAEENIRKIEFTCTANDNAKYGPGNFVTTGTYTYSGKVGTWKGDSSSISFTAKDNQVRVTEMKIYFAA